METIKLNYWYDLPENYTGIIEWNTGIISYYLNGFYHREDGPAVTHPNGNMYYLNNNHITKEVKDWIIENNIPKVWDNSHKLIFKLTFG